MKKLLIMLMAISILFTSFALNILAQRNTDARPLAKAATTTSVVVSPHTWNPGCSDTYKVYGYLKKRGLGVVGKTVKLYRSLDNRSWGSPIATLTTGSRGYFQKRVAIYDAGTVYYKAVFSGDSQLLSSSGVNHVHRGNDSCE